MRYSLYLLNLIKSLRNAIGYKSNLRKNGKLTLKDLLFP
jgi:hypothetical protein